MADKQDSTRSDSLLDIFANDYLAELDGVSFEVAKKRLVNLIIDARIEELERLKSMSIISDAMIFAKDMPLKGRYYAVYGKNLDTRIKQLSETAGRE